MNLDGDMGLTVLVDNLEGEMLDIVLDGLVLELLSDETFLLHSQYTSIREVGHQVDVRYRRLCVRGWRRIDSWLRLRQDARRL
ncbi:hypothetical protein GMOD_00002580 [Pyrenophora seminiperda CCB06]|uniref:Uncharacterized protein n=1 Tax=Pyrenophora seminiperda CCB06 TaxID=1302712 RepID=A0A3M7M2P1_9PLEO|nr:hypothetical protein GMOD_00002580 [Pyrenophora seminiperda CCB06]